MPYIDFAALKARVSIEQAAQLLGLQLRKSAAQLRGACPACQQGGDRALALTPAKQLFYCFGGQVGGDCIALVAHIKGIKVQVAATWLDGRVSNPAPPRTEPAPKAETPTAAGPGFKPLDYLVPDHDAVIAAGFDPEECKVLGIGYAPKGVLRGTVAVPIRDESGTLLGYIGVMEALQPPRGLLNPNVVPFAGKKSA